MRFLGFTSLCLLLISCGDDLTGTGGGGAGEQVPPEPLPALSKAPLSTEERLVPSRTPELAGAHDPRLPEDMDEMLASGYGDYTLGAGEAVTTRTLDGSAAPAPGPNARVLARFVHFADIQLADDESPARLVNADSPDATSGAFRPQEGHECKIANAAVRTINKLHESQPIDVVILGGDNADNAQTNEVDWVMAILSGSASVDCDSGADDDPVPGPANDPKDPFYADGLKMPWVWVTGNHDVLQQGNFPPAPKEADYLASYCGTGTRDWSVAGGPTIIGDVIPDERRKPLSGSELLEKVRADGDGHGVTAEAAASGRAFYAYDIPNTPVRILVIDTAAPTGSAEGLVRQSELDGFLRPELDAAEAEGKYVVVTSHHASSKLTDGGEFGGTVQADAVLPDPFRDVLGEYPNLLMHLAGHTHVHRVTVVDPPAPTSAPYWEVETSALADFPNQLRVIEVRDLDNGFLGIRSVVFDYQSENDPIAEDGRKRAITDFTSGWASEASGTASERNVELYVAKP
jgi:3',5'-cyclic AMP phosphodiesterase CpdA